MTGLSRTTVATLVGDLQSAGLVVEADDGDARSGAGGRGRPPVLLRLDPSAGVALGVDFGHRHVRVAVADLSSTVLAERRIESTSTTPPPRRSTRRRELVDDVLARGGRRARPGRRRRAWACRGRSTAGTRTVGSAMILPGWAGLDAGRGARAPARHPRRGRQRREPRRARRGYASAPAAGCANVVYVKVSSGIGAGLVLGGRLHRGATGIAGELGHVQVAGRRRRRAAAAAAAACETVAAVPALLAAARGRRTGPTSSWPGMLELVAAATSARGASSTTRAGRSAACSPTSATTSTRRRSSSAAT